MGSDPEEQREQGLLHLQYASPVELRIDAVVVEMFRTVRERGIRRVVIDGLGNLRLASLVDTLVTLAIDFEADPPRRLIRVVKARGGEHSLSAHPFIIDADGLRIEGTDGA